MHDPGPDQWTWGDAPLANRDSTKNLGLVLTADCEWEAHAKLARRKGQAAFHMWKRTLQNPHITMRAKLAIINSCIKPCMTYGMELWTPPRSILVSLEVPVRQALRAALGVPRGPGRARYPSALLHHDSAVRTLASDNRAAHVRYWSRVRHLPAGRLQQQTLAMLPPDNPWLTRVSQWRAEMVAVDPESASSVALAGDAPEPSDVTNAVTNPAINRAVALGDALRYADTAHTRSLGVMSLALRGASCAAPQAYVLHGSVQHILPLRSGRFHRDPVSPPDHDDAPPPCVACPDCACVVSCESVAFAPAARALRMALHRVTSCTAVRAVFDWYRDVAVRLSPGLPMALALVGAARCEGLWAAGCDAAWERAALPFLRHLLDPTAVCRAQDLVQRRRMLDATALFLAHTDASAAPGVLPVPADFGGLPLVSLAPYAHVTIRPVGATIDDAFWRALADSLPFSVLPALASAPGHEAEALWASPRRRSARVRGRGVVSD